jgi:2-dehydro-3-deoxyphosphooctonate aldolase (KDO 8-P synthase)
MTTREISAGSIKIGSNNPLAFIAGPCVIESEEATLKAAYQLKEISDKRRPGYSGQSEERDRTCRTF